MGADNLLEGMNINGLTWRVSLMPASRGSVGAAPLCPPPGNGQHGRGPTASARHPRAARSVSLAGAQAEMAGESEPEDLVSLDESTPLSL